jgi:hypothetical protein
MNLQLDDYIGIVPGVFSKRYKDMMDPLDFLSDPKNLWMGAWLFSYYPSSKSVDLLILLPKLKFALNNHHFLMSVLYGDSFSIVDSVNGILDDCKVESFEIIIVKDFYLCARARIKVGDVIPYDMSGKYKEKTPNDFLRGKIDISEIAQQAKTALIKLDECVVHNVSLYGIGDILGVTRKISIVPHGDNRYDKNVIVNFYFDIPVWQHMKDDVPKTIEMLKKGVYFNNFNNIKNLFSWTSKTPVIPQKNEVKLILGKTYNFTLSNPKVYDLSYVIKHNERDDEKSHDENKQETQTYCLKILGDVKYELTLP